LWDLIFDHYFQEPVDYVNVSDLDFVEDAEIINCSLISESSNRLSFKEECISKISSNADVVLMYGVGIITGDILTKPSEGVLHYHHGDLRKHRGSPAMFWEFMNDDSKSGVTVQRLTEKLDAGEIISYQEVHIGDLSSWYEIKKKMYDESKMSLVDAIKNISSDEFEPQTITEDNKGELHVTSDITNITRLKFVIKSIKKRIRSSL
jgi:methionyl-tRNA formyltransferase